MKNLIAALLISTILTTCAFTQAETDLQKESLKGSVRKVESYETDFGERGEDTRHLNGITTYNRAGETVEALWLTNDGNGSYYQRFLYYYDTEERKIMTERYVSTKSKRNEYFNADASQIPGFNLLSRLKESLSTRAIHKYDRKGREVEESVADANGGLVEKKVFEYGEDGKLIKFAVLDPNNAPRWGSRSYYRNNGSIVETDRTEKGVEFFRVIQYYDEKGRIVKEEQYQLKPALHSVGEKEYVIDNRSTKTYKGDLTEMEWVLFDPSGAPTTKLIIVDKNDDELSREEFLYEPLETDQVDSRPISTWRLNSREIHEYEYDKEGNWIKDISLTQQNPGEEPQPNTMYERVITYY